MLLLPGDRSEEMQTEGGGKKRGTGATEVGFVMFFSHGDSWSGIGSETMKKEPLNRS